ncbi:hypothetical protein HBN99_03720 [Pseudomonas oryzihabitans]|uniref:hypothetical protein n=1 Tax=Pseudomonas oryzihabitans TaxID=47885 RepID=UPI0014730BF7|nr:hypothetical protein [Pseudomonas oryzihabitans]NMZ63428.1 hypothetical protein [Pseudomonas oryzihabitans]
MDFPIELETGVTILGVKDPVWGNREESFINCVITITGLMFTEPNEVPFTANPLDEMQHGRDLFEHLKDTAAPYERRDVTVADLQADLDALMPDILLGLATEEEISLARTLRTQIKAMSE